MLIVVLLCRIDIFQILMVNIYEESFLPIIEITVISMLPSCG